jgi:hypothetical protein
MVNLSPAADVGRSDYVFAEPCKAFMCYMQTLFYPVGALHGLLQGIPHLGQAIAQLIPLRLDDLKSYGDLQKFPMRV